MSKAIRDAPGKINQIVRDVRYSEIFGFPYPELLLSAIPNHFVDVNNTYNGDLALGTCLKIITRKSDSHGY